MMIKKTNDLGNYDKVIFYSILAVIFSRFLPQSIQFYVPIIVFIISLILLVRHLICKSSVIIISICALLSIVMGLMSAIKLISVKYVQYLSVVPLLWKINGVIFIIFVNVLNIILLKFYKNKCIIISIWILIINIIAVLFLILI
ncbi:hypothetical protein SDC9_179645 [bioreactor metagenome]|uniref:Uncharacterized protein n=1 Tax=bioreactor metagenome TaxID=1076179 RepID=A0A645H2G1_9ZZZZ